MLNQDTSTFTSSYGLGGDPKSQRPRVLVRPSSQAPPSPRILQRPSVTARNASPPPIPTAPRQHTESAEDLEAERMVDSIVGLPEDSPPQQRLNVNTRMSPKTPARPPPTSSTTFGTASPFPVGSSTVADIMASTFRKPSPHHHSGTAMARSTSGSRTTSQLQSPAFAPSLPRQQSNGSNGSMSHVDMQRIWDSPQGDNGPSGLTRRTSGQGFSPSLAPRSSPLALPRSHSRGNSNELNPSIWSPNVPSANGLPRPEAQSMSRSSSARNLGNGAFFGTTSPSAPDIQQSGTDYGSTLQSPTPNVTPWNADYRSQKRVSAGSPLAPTSAQLPNGYGQDHHGINSTSPPHHDSYSAHAKTFRPSNLQNTRLHSG